MSRKFERIKVSLPTLKPCWEEVAFCDIENNDIIKITDYDDNGKISVDGEDGKKILIVKSKPKSIDGNLAIETEEIFGTEEDALTYST